MDVVNKNIPNLNSELNDSKKTNQENKKYLLPPLNPSSKRKKTLVIDLDETLVHSSVEKSTQAAYITPTNIDGKVQNFYVFKRPYVDMFLHRLSKIYELVLFTASVPSYADPLVDRLDPYKLLEHRLYREHCILEGQNFIKNLDCLGRPLENIIILDNSPASYLHNPENAVPIPSWFDDKSDRVLLELLPILENELLEADDVRCHLKNAHTFEMLCKSTQSHKRFEQKTTIKKKI